MDFTTMFPTIGSIAVICMLFGQILKSFPQLPTKYIPIGTLIAGGLLGIVGHFTAISGLSTINLFDAIATGIVSGIASSGAFSLYKNITDQYEGNS